MEVIEGIMGNRTISNRVGQFFDILTGKWDLENTADFMDNTYAPLTIVITPIYVALVVVIGPYFMRNRKPMNLDAVLVVWNFSLALYSGISGIILLPHLVDSLRRGGIQGSICYNDNQHTDPLAGYVNWLYAMSKGAELLDTAFLVLRKRNVIFLHWYHHSLMFFALGVYYTEFVPWIRYVFTINLLVHTIMYAYYGFRALRWRIPRWIPKAITSMQIVQFTIVFYVAAYTFEYTFWNPDSGPADCEANAAKIVEGTAMIVTYFVLFCKLYYDNYIRKEPSKEIKAE